MDCRWTIRGVVLTVPRRIESILDHCGDAGELIDCYFQRIWRWMFATVTRMLGWCVVVGHGVQMGVCEVRKVEVVL